MAYKTEETEHTSKKFEVTKYDGMKAVAKGSIIITYNCKRIGIVDYLWVEKHYENENFATTILIQLKEIAKKENCQSVIMLHDHSEWAVFSRRVMDEGV